MENYLSCLLDYRSKELKDHIKIDCKYQDVARRLGEFGIVDGRFLKILKGEYPPIEKYEEYRNYCIGDLEIPKMKPVINLEYIAAIFDLAGSFKVNRKAEKYYPNVTFRDETFIEILSHYYKKASDKELIFNGDELIYTLEDLKSHLIYRQEEAEMLCEFSANTDNHEVWDRFSIHKKEKKVREKLEKVSK